MKLRAEYDFVDIAKVEPELAEALELLNEPTSRPGTLDAAELDEVKMQRPELYARWEDAAQTIRSQRGDPTCLNELRRHDFTLEGELQGFDRDYVTTQGVLDTYKIDRLPKEMRPRLENLDEKIEDLIHREGNRMSAGMALRGAAVIGVSVVFPPAMPYVVGLVVGEMAFQWIRTGLGEDPDPSVSLLRHALNRTKDALAYPVRWIMGEV